MSFVSTKNVSLHENMTLQEQILEHQRVMERCCREINREKMSLRQEEKKTVAEIRKLARDGQEPAAKALAKALVHIRTQIKRMFGVVSYISVLSGTLTNLNSAADVYRSMACATKLMMRMNDKMNMPAMQKITMEFRRLNKVLGLTDEMLIPRAEDFLDGDHQQDSREYWRPPQLTG